MEALAEIPDPLNELPFHERVHVFVGAVDERWIAPAALEDVGKGGRDHLGLRRAENSCAGKPFNPRQASSDIVLEQAPVESKRRPELKGGRVRVAAETS